MVVQHNLSAMNANRMLNVTTSAQSKSTEKLSSGYKINRAADDAAGLSISEKMRKQIRGLDQAVSNAQDGISAVQTAEGALTEVHSMLQRMNELAVQASNGTNSSNDRQSIQDEIDQLTTEIDRVAETTKFNETYLLKGGVDGKTKTTAVNAHDAGLAGKLAESVNGKTTFTADDLKIGDTVKIGGKDYKIGESAASADYAKKGSVTPTAVGDSVTSNGTKTTIVDKVTTTTANGATWAANDTFKDADGKTWTVVANATGTTSATAGTVKVSDVANYLKDGCTIVSNAADAAGANVLAGTKVVDELGKNEVSIADTQGITTLTNSIKAGDVVSAGGTTKIITAETPKTYDELAKETALDTAGTTVKIGSKSYTIGTSTDLDANKITKDDFLSMIKDGDKVTIGTNDYTAVIKTQDDDTITLTQAYDKMAKELEAASSIGADTAATVKNNGNGTFEITQGTVDVKESLSFNLHVGADADMTNKIGVTIDAMNSASLGVKGINVTDDSGIAGTYAVDAIADAISKVSSQRSALGAVQNRLEHTTSNLNNVVENTTSAESSIRDTDMAEEMVTYSKNNILAQAGQSMLAQANQSNQGVLSLLQ